MLIKLKEGKDVPVRYYQHCSDGRPVLGRKQTAAQFNRDQGEAVLRQLRDLDRRFESAELVAEC